MSIQRLKSIRDRALPMFEVAAQEYRDRVPKGYPSIVDDPERGVIGLELDPSYSLYITSDGKDVFAELYRRLPRTDSRSTAGRQKYGGMPFSDRRPVNGDLGVQEIRNLIAELKNYWNMQPGILFITDD